MFTQSVNPLPPRRTFVRRQLNTLTIGLALVAVSLAIGIFGFHSIEHLAWVDAFLNAAMLLGGMGPVAEMKTTTGKLFAGIYALYSGLVLLIAANIIFAPTFQRILHLFHLRDFASNEQDKSSNTDRN